MVYISNMHQYAVVCQKECLRPLNIPRQDLHCMCLASEKQGEGQAESAESPNPKWYYLNVKLSRSLILYRYMCRESLH